MRTLEQRVTTLERRLETVEARLGLKPVEKPAPEAPKPPPAPAPEPRLVSRRPKPKPKPKRSLEIDFGRWLLSRIGGLALVLAAGFLFHYTARIGLLGPKARLLLGAFAGFGLIAAGEWQSRRLRFFSGALSGAGFAIVYVCIYAGYGLYGFYSSGVALTFVGLMTIGGAAQALRHRIEAIAALAAVGGFLAPVLVLDPHAGAVGVLAYLVFLNAGLCALRLKTGWISAEAIAWVGTALCAALPLSRAPHEWGLVFLLLFVALFSVRPRLRPTRSSPAVTLVLAAVTTAVSFLLFRMREAPYWSVFIGGLGAVSLVGAWAGRVRAPAIAATDLVAGIAMVVLATLDGLSGWSLTAAWSVLAAALALLPGRELKKTMRPAGLVVALLALQHLGWLHAHDEPGLLVAHLFVAGAAAAIGHPAMRWAAVAIAGVGFATTVAQAHDAVVWGNLALLDPIASVPSVRLLCAGTLGALAAGYALYVRERRILLGIAAYLAAAVLGDALFLIDGGPFLPAGVLAGLVVFWLGIPSIVPVALGLLVAVAGDLIPPAGYWPFLNRRAFALAAVLAAGWVALRRRPERVACVLAGALVAALEVASVASRTGGAVAWRHLWLDMRTAADALPFLNARFLFLVGTAATAFLAARRWPRLLVAGHVYLVLALGVEAVGLVNGGVRQDPWRIFSPASQHMAEQLALTGVLLLYGATLVVSGIARRGATLRYAGLSMLVAGAAKVCLIDLAALDDLYRVGSFVVVGSTFLLGSYAYNRWVKDEEEAALTS